MIPRSPRRALKSDLNFCFMSRMVLDRVCGTNGLGDPDVRDAISTLDDIAKEASGNDKKVKLETRESVPELAWTASLSCRDAQNEVTIDFYFRHENN